MQHPFAGLTDWEHMLLFDVDSGECRYFTKNEFASVDELFGLAGPFKRWGAHPVGGDSFWFQGRLLELFPFSFLPQSSFHWALRW